jgi:hypothetical protein
MKFRVKQIDDNTFIPQCRSWYDFDWKSIDKIDNYSWSICTDYAHHSTLEDAMYTIERHKKYIEQKNKYPKYHKV